MENSTKIKLGLSAVLLGLTAVTLNYIMKQVKLLVNTKFDFDGGVLSKLTLSNIDITLFWKVTNKSDFSFTVKNQVYDIYLNDTFVKKVGASESIDILAKGTSRIPTYINLTAGEILNVGLQNLGDLVVKEQRDKIKLKVKGYFTIRASIFTFKQIPFEFEKRLGDF